jgi:diguanylate cyclase (GGDEF)-like protein/PAS domain S-box-containing protein
MRKQIDLKDIRILYVEDMDEARVPMVRFFQRQGAEVFEALNGREGLAIFQSEQPDIIITDIRMPEMDGLAMSQAIRKCNPDIPILVMTAHNELELVRQSLDLSVTQYVVKPVNGETLVSALEVAMQKLRAQQETLRTLTALKSEVIARQGQDSVVQERVKHLLHHHEANLGEQVRVLDLPHGAVSGDFYTVQTYGEIVYVLLADGMGHGLPALLPAINLPEKFRSLAGRGFGLVRIADELNEVLSSRHMVDHFLAAVLIQIDPERHQIEVINCGMPPVLLFDENGRLIREFESLSLSLGAVDSDHFLPEVEDFHMDRPGQLVLCSDGLTDVLQVTAQKSGFTALVDLVQGTKPGKALAKIEQLLQLQNREQWLDDVTVLNIIYTPAKPQLMPAVQSIQRILASCLNTGHDSDPVKWLSVVYIEDDSDAREAMSRYLRRRVGVLHAAASAEEGLVLFKRYRPQLVISDIWLPGMRGIELVNKIREIDPDVPIILIGGESSLSFYHERVGELIELDINKFLPKPLDGKALLDSIQQSLKQFDRQVGMRLSVSVFMYSPLAMLVTDAERNIVATNPAFTEITGYAYTEVLGRNPRILSSGKMESSFYRHMWGIISDIGRWSGEIWNRRKNGELYLEWITIHAIRDDKGDITHFAAIFSDMTQRSAVEEKMRHLANHDALTDLPNRVLLGDRLKQAILQAQREREQLTMIYLDIDHFKDVNDTLGHGAGDELIKAVASTLCASVRESDTVCRLGGDEFAILLPDVGSKEMAGRLAEKVFNSVSKVYQIADKQMSIQVSMGVAMFPQDGEDADELLKHADTAMYQAKQQGRNSYRFFDPALEDQAQRLLQLKQGLYRALYDNELYLVYQPKYAASQHRIVGLEALLRWKSATLGEVSPAEFIPIAEDTGLIVEIGQWVIEKVCRDLAEWRAQCIPAVPVAINISPIHFYRGNLKTSLLQVINSYRIPACLLQIELTESTVMNLGYDVVAMIEELRELGVTISVDDFGTGYSSLSYLRNLPIDELKIDRSFIAEITDAASLGDTRLTAIPRAIIELATNLNLRLVAEGVENVVQRDFLMAHGCDVIQGYFYSKPLVEEAIRNLLVKNLLHAQQFVNSKTTSKL